MLGKTWGGSRLLFAQCYVLLYLQGSFFLDRSRAANTGQDCFRFDIFACFDRLIDET